MPLPAIQTGFPGLWATSSAVKASSIKGGLPGSRAAAVKQAACSIGQKPGALIQQDFSPEIEKALKAIEKRIQGANTDLLCRFFTIKLRAGRKSSGCHTLYPSSVKADAEQMIARCETALKDDRESLTASGRNLYIAKLSAACLKKGRGGLSSSPRSSRPRRRAGRWRTGRRPRMPAAGRSPCSLMASSPAVARFWASPAPDADPVSAAGDPGGLRPRGPDGLPPHADQQRPRRTGDSIPASLGRPIAPLFEPLGWGQRQAAVAAMMGLVSRENVVSLRGTPWPRGKQPRAASRSGTIRGPPSPRSPLIPS